MEAGFSSLIIMVACLIALIVMIMKFKIHPVFTLIIVAVVGALGFGFPIEEVFSVVTGGFGSTIGNIGIVIILGTAIGVILEDTGGALVLANTILKFVGKKNSKLAMGLSGYLVSIPVFSDSAIVIMSPVARALSARSGVPLVALLGALNAGIMATHTMVPPTPGPLAAAGTLGADLGLLIILGLVTSAAYTAAATMWCGSKYMTNKYPEPAKVAGVEAALDDEFTLTSPDGQPLPSAFLAFSSILVPVILICVNSFGSLLMDPGSPILPYLGFIGHPIFALFMGVIIALMMGGDRLTLDQCYKWFDDSVDRSGFIILATGAAGAFGAVLKASGVGTYLGNLIAQTGLSAIFVPYLVSLLLSVSNGSATVSLITGSAIILPLMPSLGLSPVIATLAIAAGSSFFYHANASHFWVVLKANDDLPMSEGYELVSVGTAIGSLAAMVVVFIMSLFIHV
ncbi:putative Gluconate permease [[Clostridium] ultunense Esp]|uniref:Putative Gluconate permease n=1 Tax=[Clostridium] ultunense Esp TaxID=1288971 RepID=M1ZB85_9FIRM|nr:GntP family permease [Schnuerera ultunensis]CCQ95209.1 putative Gluconate permease [[Clostridium] ultunense Esp]SHD75903.1 putative Gluconate permease [[Clostridium] ultunense Esp]